MSELLPCPFCGGEARTSGEAFENTILSLVYCTSCGAAGGYRHTEAEAAEAWNTRYHSAYEETVIKALKEIKAWNTSQRLRAFDTVETAQRVAELEMELADAKAEIRKL